MVQRLAKDRTFIMQKSILLVLWNLCATVLLFLAVDYGYSNFFVDPGPLRRDHAVWHHTLAPNVMVWDENPAGDRNLICTDRHGFRINCFAVPPRTESLDLAFLGDSFTEGLGVAWHESFVGMFAKAQPQLEIANLGVSSYFPAIYLVKVRHLLDQGVRFEHLLVLIDVSDIHNETRHFIDAEGHVRTRPGLNRLAEEDFRLSAMLYAAIRYGSLHPIAHFRSGPFPRHQAEWTYQADSSHYGDMGVAGGIALAVSHMESLHELLQAHDILLSVAVYPWPAQLKYDNLADNRQSRIWRDFCRGRCAMYIDAFPAFHALVSATSAESVYRNFYITGDIHFNERGNQLLFDLLDDSWSAFQGRARH